MASCKDMGYTCTLIEETLEIAKTELNEDPSTRLLEIKTLRERLEQYPGLKARLDPQFLLRFLRARKFDQERAFELVLNYYRMRKEEPAIFVGLKPSAVRHVMAESIAYPLPHRDRLGRQIYRISPTRAMDKSRHSLAEVFKVEFLNLSKLIEEEETQVRGFTLLVDYKDFGMGHFLQMETEFVRRISKIWADAFPGRLKLCLMVNEPQFIDMVVAMFASFAKAKHIKRIHRIGTDWKKLHEYIDPASLPACYGGTLPEEPWSQDWTDQMMQCDKEMEEESKYGFVDYTMDPKQDQKQEDAFTNMAGTFKKLDMSS